MLNALGFLASKLLPPNAPYKSFKMLTSWLKCVGIWSRLLIKCLPVLGIKVDENIYIYIYIYVQQVPFKHIRLFNKFHRFNHRPSNLMSKLGHFCVHFYGCLQTDLVGLQVFGSATTGKDVLLGICALDSQKAQQ